MRAALVSSSQSIAFGAKPDLGPIERFDDASRMNGAELLPRWREKTGSHKNIGAVSSIHRPARFTTEQFSRHCSIATANQFTFSGCSRHHFPHIRLVPKSSFKQRCEQAGLTFPLDRLHHP